MGSGLVTIDTIEFILRAGVVQQNVNVTIDGEGWVSPGSGTCFTGQGVEFSALPAEGFQFAGWTGSLISPDNPLIVTVDSDLSLIAHFFLIPERYTVNIIAENGTVEQTPFLTEYIEDSLVILNAIPNSGYKFESWGGDASGITNPLSITMDSNKDIIANFILETGLYESIFSRECKVYPNPANERIHVLNVPIGASISLLSMEGKLMKILKAQERIPSIDVIDIEPGIYLLAVKTNSGKYIMKVVIK